MIINQKAYHLVLNPHQRDYLDTIAKACVYVRAKLLNEFYDEVHTSRLENRVVKNIPTPHAFTYKLKQLLDNPLLDGVPRNPLYREAWTLGGVCGTTLRQGGGYPAHYDPKDPIHFMFDDRGFKVGNGWVQIAGLKEPIWLKGQPKQLVKSKFLYVIKAFNGGYRIYLVGGVKSKDMVKNASTCVSKRYKKKIDELKLPIRAKKKSLNKKRMK